MLNLIIFKMISKKLLLNNIIQDEKDIKNIHIVINALKEVRDNQTKRDNEIILINDIIQRMNVNIKFLQATIKAESNYLKRGYF